MSQQEDSLTNPVVEPNDKINVSFGHFCFHFNIGHEICQRTNKKRASPKSLPFSSRRKLRLCLLRRRKTDVRKPKLLSILCIHLRRKLQTSSSPLFQFKLHRKVITDRHFFALLLTWNPIRHTFYHSSSFFATARANIF